MKPSEVMVSLMNKHWRMLKIANTSCWRTEIPTVLWVRKYQQLNIKKMKLKIIEIDALNDMQYSYDGRLKKFCYPHKRILHRSSLQKHRQSIQHKELLAIYRREHPSWNDNDSDYEQTMDPNDVYENWLICRTCNKAILKKNWNRHEMQSMRHKQRMEKYKNQNLKKRSKSNEEQPSSPSPTPAKRTRRTALVPNIKGSVVVISAKCKA